MQKYYSQPTIVCCECGESAMDEGAQSRGRELICVHCVKRQSELLRIGMRGGRALIEQSKPKAKHDRE